MKCVTKGQVVANLVEAGIFQLDLDGKVLNKWETEGDAPPIFSVLPKTKGEIEFGSALVCWQVEIAGDVHSQTWMDKTIQQSWADYAASEKAEKGFCLVQGEESVISTMHPAKLRHTGDKAKLISSNDTAGYTFRGRFATAEEAASISADVSAKAHSALRWLISRQGIRNGDQVTVAWAISGKPVPSPVKDISTELDWADMDNWDISAVENPDEFSSQTSSKQPSPDWSVNIGRAAAQIIKKKLHGYRKELKEHEQISLIMLDSATPGRMALTYYQEFLPADYFANLDAWVDDFSWYQRYSIEVPNGKKPTSVPNGASSRRRLTALPNPCTAKPYPTRSKNSFMPAFCPLSQAEHPCRFPKIWCVKVFRRPAILMAAKTGNGKETSALPVPYTKAGALVITIYYNGELTP